MRRRLPGRRQVGRPCPVAGALQGKLVELSGFAEQRGQCVDEEDFLAGLAGHGDGGRNSRLAILREVGSFALPENE